MNWSALYHCRCTMDFLMISLLAFSRYTPESLLCPLSCHLLSLFSFLSHSQESKCPCISFFHILLLHSIGIFVLLKHLHICCHMQMQNNKPGLCILQTGAGGLSRLILTQYSSMLITGDRGVESVWCRNIFSP